MRIRLINFRPLLFAFLGLIIGIIISRLFLFNLISLWVFIVICGIIVVLSVLGFIYSHKLKNHDCQNPARKNVYIYLRLSLIMLLVSFIVGGFYASMPLIKMKTISDLDEIKISGIVSDYVKTSDNSVSFLIKNCVVDGKEKLEYNVKVTTSKYANINLGDEIQLECNLNSFYYGGDYDFSNLIAGVGYSTYVSYDKITKSGFSPTLSDITKNSVDDILHSNLSDENADISMAILFGDKESLDSNLRSTFSRSGIAHILAVSGLHVSVLFAILYCLLNKIRMNKWITFSIYLVFLFLYSYLCGFAVSVMRASIMALIFAISRSTELEYDSISSMSVAGIIILFINPLALFSVSFQLSFLCILSIICISPEIVKILNKIKCPKILSSTLALSISTNLILVPIMMNVFEQVSLIGVFLNIIVIPIFTIAFSLLVVTTILASIVSIFRVLLFLPDIFLHIIKWIAGLGANLDMLYFNAFRVGYWVVAFVILLSLIIHYLMINKRLKLIVNSILIIIIMSSMIVGLIPNNYSDGLLLYSQTNTNIVYYCENGSTTLIGIDIDYEQLKSMSNKLKIRNIDNIIAYDFELNNISNATKICNNMGVKTLYLPSKYDYQEVSQNLPNAVCYDEILNLSNITCESIEYNEKVVGCKLKTKDDVGILIEKYNVSKLATKKIEEYIDKKDYYITVKLNNYHDLQTMGLCNIITYRDVKNSEIQNLQSIFKSKKYLLKLEV